MIRTLLLVFLALPFISAPQDAYAQGSEYVGAYNSLLKGLNPRLQFVGLGEQVIAEKQPGESVTQADLNEIRSRAVSMAKNSFISKGASVPAPLKDMNKQGMSKPDEAKYDDINNYFLPAWSSAPGVGNIMDGIGNGSDKFTKVPGKYVSDGTSIYAETFTDVPVLGIHFEELAALINKLKTARRSMSWTDSWNRFSRASQKDGYIYMSMQKTTEKNPGFCTYVWVGTGEFMYKRALSKARIKYNGNTPTNCWLKADASAPMYSVSYSLRSLEGGYERGTSPPTPNAEINITTSRAYAPITPAMTSCQIYVIAKNTTGSYKDNVSSSSVVRSISSVNKSEDTSSIYSEFFYYSDGLSDPSCAPPLDPTGEPIIGNPCYVSGGWTSAALVFTVSLPDATVDLPRSNDKDSDGLVDTGCTCTSCKQALEDDFNKLSGCAEARYPLGIGNGNTDGIRIKSYVSEQKYSWGTMQAYSLHTRVSGFSSGSENGHSWSFAEVLRPSGATVVFNLLDEKPLNNKDYRLYKVVGEDSYEIKFPEDGGAVYHKFSRDISGGYPIVQCRKDYRDSKLSTDSTGLGQWNGLFTSYQDGISGGKIDHVSWALGDSAPNYGTDNLVTSVSYSKGAVALQTSEVETSTVSGKDRTLYLQKNASGVVEAKKEILRDPKTGGVTINEYETGIIPEYVIRSTVYAYSTDDFDNRMVTETATVSGKSMTTITTYRNYPWGQETIKSVQASGTAAERTVSYEYYEDPLLPGYGKMKSMSAGDGSWTRWTYDAVGRTHTVASPFVNSPFSSTDAQCRLTHHTYSATDEKDFRPTQVDEYVLNTPVSRTFYTYSDTESRVIRAVSKDAAADDVGNLVTITEKYPESAGAPKGGRIRKTTAPDGTITVYDYTTAANGGLKTTVDSGAGSGYSVTDGTSSITYTDAAGNTASSTSTDIASGIQISSQTYTRDEFGRATFVDYGDGTNTETHYGCCGPEWEKDREGTVTETMYDGMKRVTSTTTAGICTLYAYDVSGGVASTTRRGSDGTECTTYSTYDAAGELVSVKDPEGNVTSYSANYSGCTRTTNYSGGTTSTVKSNADGSVAYTGGSAVHGVRYIYSIDNGQLCTQSCPSAALSQWIRTYTDFLGRTYRTVFADLTESVTYYDGSSGRPYMQKSAGHTTLTAYNAKGEVVKSAVDLNANDAIDDDTDRVTEYSSTVTGSVRRQTVKQNNVVVSVSDTSLDGLNSSQTSFGRTSSSITVLNGNGQKTVTITSPDGSSVVQTYANGRLKSSVHSVLGTTSYVYDPHGRISSVSQTTGNGPQTTLLTYDKNDRTMQTTVNGSRITSFTYDSMGRMTKMTLPDGRTVNYSFASTGEVTTVSGADTYPVAYSYDGLGRMRTLSDGNGSTTTWGYDPMRGFMTSKTYADGARSAFSYNPDGSVKTRTWARGIVTNYTYNAAGELLGVTYADDGRPTTGDISFTRDRFGRPTTVQDGTGTRTLAYNDDSTLASEEVPYVSGYSVVYSYDAAKGRMDGMQLKNGGTVLAGASYSYDGMSRLASVGSAGVSPAVVASYIRVPDLSQLSSTTVASGATDVLTVGRTYDSLNRLKSISSGSAGFSPAISYSYAFDASDRRSKVTFSDNSSWQYGYDDKGQITSAVKRASDGTVLDRFSYAFDSIGNRMQSGTSYLGAQPAVSSYTSNSLNQYTQRTIPGSVEVSGEADPAADIAIQRISMGNVEAAFAKDATRTGKYFSKVYALDNSQEPVSEKFKIYAVNAAGTLVASEQADVFLPKTPNVYSYDPDGNLTSDGRFTYSWDGENRLSSVSSLSSLSSRIKDECAYDYTSRRTSKNVYGWVNDAWQLSKTEKYVWSGWQLIGIFNASNQLMRSYVWGEDGLISDTDVLNGKTYLAVKDGNFNIVGYVDASDGKLVASYEYDAFGRIVCRSGIKADDFNFRFASYQFDDETGFVYYGYRYYNPETGRWLGRDPMEERGGSNLYAMCSNDAVNGWDYLGRENLMGTIGFNILDAIFNPDIASSKAQNAISDSIANTWDRRTRKYNAAPAEAFGLTGFHRELAELSNSVYKDSGAPDGWKRLSKNELPSSLKLAKLNTSNSPNGFYAALYEKTMQPDNCKKVLAYRGTEGLFDRDWLYGNAQGLGILTSQYEQAINLGKAVKREYSDNLYYLTGHSLGGGLASATAIVINTPAVVFNPAGVHPSTVEGYGANLNNADSLITRYVVRGEILNYENYNIPPTSLPLLNYMRYKNNGNGLAPDSIGKQIYLRSSTPPSVNPLSAIDMHSMHSVLSAYAE
ncbi:MAG: RHS repeat-associated core domain-containing protein [Victivallales bacterium]